MASSRRRTTSAIPAPADPLERALGAIVAEARAQVAARRTPDPKALAGRVHAAAARRREELGPGAGDEVDRAEREALAQLDQVVAVARAYRRLAQAPAPPPPPSAAGPGPGLPRRFGGLRARPTISGNLELRRAAADGVVTLSWDPVPAVKAWEVRIGERPDPRADYETRETVVLEPGVTAVAVPLGEHPVRVNVIGQARDGRPVRRALVSALTRENWDDRWERRATAS